MPASPSNELIESMDSAQPGMNAAQQFFVVKAPLERVYEQYLGNFKRLVENEEVIP
jgi:hypothetical protein